MNIVSPSQQWTEGDARVSETKICTKSSFFQAALIPYGLVFGLDVGGEHDLAGALHCVFCLFVPPYAAYGGVYYIQRVSGLWKLAYTFYFEKIRSRIKKWEDKYGCQHETKSSL